MLEEALPKALLRLVPEDETYQYVAILGYVFGIVTEEPAFAFFYGARAEGWVSTQA